MIRRRRHLCTRAPTRAAAGPNNCLQRVYRAATGALNRPFTTSGDTPAARRPARARARPPVSLVGTGGELHCARRVAYVTLIDATREPVTAQRLDILHGVRATLLRTGRSPPGLGRLLEIFTKYVFDPPSYNCRAAALARSRQTAGGRRSAAVSAGRRRRVRRGEVPSRGVNKSLRLDRRLQRA
ncbi:hypothetical protein EVAR_50600_1 [Eumeta japonica]|uniref:Uncharacterized protein n=1 Tax=Eumeta variegata TaxID=151549 RepID=A0A4C1Y7T8_EUMVA|nr:hypothetical protein EVAR_50600_1 [Eumeta japonica]